MTREALVLTAGLGTRLRPLTDVRAKAAIPVAGQPMIHRIIRALVAQGVDDLVLNLHHLPATLTAVVGDGSDLGARVRYSWEPMILGSGGGPRLAQAIVGARTFWIINGDTLTDVNMAALAAQHASSLARVTLALFFERRVKYLLDYATLKGNLSRIGAKRVILTHMGPEMLSHKGDVPEETAEDGKIVEI